MPVNMIESTQDLVRRSGTPRHPGHPFDPPPAPADPATVSRVRIAADRGRNPSPHARPAARATQGANRARRAPPRHHPSVPAAGRCAGRPPASPPAPDRVADRPASMSSTRPRPRPLGDQLVGPLRRSAVDRPGHGEHRPVPAHRLPHRVHRPTCPGRLDDHDCVRQRCDDPVADREPPRAPPVPRAAPPRPRPGATSAASERFRRGHGASSPPPTTATGAAPRPSTARVRRGIHSQRQSRHHGHPASFSPPASSRARAQSVAGGPRYRRSRPRPDHHIRVAQVEEDHRWLQVLAGARGYPTPPRVTTPMPSATHRRQTRGSILAAPTPCRATTPRHGERRRTAGTAAAPFGPTPARGSPSTAAIGAGPGRPRPRRRAPRRGPRGGARSGAVSRRLEPLGADAAGPPRPRWASSGPSSRPGLQGQRHRPRPLRAAHGERSPLPGPAQQVPSVVGERRMDVQRVPSSIRLQLTPRAAPPVAGPQRPAPAPQRSLSPTCPTEQPSGSGGSTSIRRSKRSSSGPDSRRRYRASCWANSAVTPATDTARTRVGGTHEQEASGQRSRRARPGDLDDTGLERLTQRIDVRRGNSPSSSRKSTPPLASEISPGRSVIDPPPTRATSEAVWCGERNGGPLRAPARDATGQRPSGPGRRRARCGGPDPGGAERRSASMVLPAPGGPVISRW